MSTPLPLHLPAESVLQRKITLQDVLDIPTFSELVRGFADLYKLGVKVFDERGQKLADIKLGNADFCAYVFSFAEGRRCCSATVARVKEGPLNVSEGARLPTASADAGSLGGMLTVPCFTGLRYLILPVMWEGDLVGRVVFGPFTPEELKDLPPSLLEATKGIDHALALQHLAQIRRAPESTVVKVMLHFAHLLEALIAAGQKTWLTSQVHIEATQVTNRELAQKNRKLEDLYQRLKELDRLKSSFLATVSHELRTPLTSIIGYSEMLDEGLAGPLNTEQTDYVRTIMEKGDTLLGLISSILDITQIESGKVRLKFESTQVSDVITSSVSTLAPQAQKKGISLEAKLPPQALQAMADTEKLKQVVVNLLANAVKFTPRGGWVRVTLTDAGHQAELNARGYRIVVQDSGVGVPGDQLDKIFQSFYQVDNSSTREFGGAGLGLAIVKSYVEGHGGKVEVLSQEGQGATFSVVLPVAVSATRESELIAPPASEALEDRF